MHGSNFNLSSVNRRYTDRETGRQSYRLLVLHSIDPIYDPRLSYKKEQFELPTHFVCNKHSLVGAFGNLNQILK